MINANGYLTDETGRVIHRSIYVEANGTIPVGWHIHHIDGKKLNNDPDNLIALPPYVHDESTGSCVKRARVWGALQFRITSNAGKAVYLYAQEVAGRGLKNANESGSKIRRITLKPIPAKTGGRPWRRKQTGPNRIRSTSIQRPWR